MALLGQGGRSRPATSGSARTRPSAASRATRSDTSMGAASASRRSRSRAASTGISADGLMDSPAAGAERRLLQMGYEVARAVAGVQLLGEDAVPGGAAGVG